MPSIWRDFVADRIEFTTRKISERNREIYIAMLAKMLYVYEISVDGIPLNQVNNLKKIIIVGDISEIDCGGQPALGCALYRAGKINSVYYDDWRFDSIVISMELAHFMTAEYFDDLDNPYYHKLSNDLIHYAANAGALPYVYREKYSFTAPFQWRGLPLAGRLAAIKRLILLNRRTVEIFLYNLPFLFNNRQRIMTEVQNGTAPKGKNAYWSKGQHWQTPAGREILAFVQHYELEGPQDHAGYHH